MDGYIEDGEFVIRWRLIATASIGQGIIEQHIAENRWKSMYCN